MEKFDKDKKNVEPTPNNLKEKVRIIVKGEDKTNSIRTWNEKNGKINITYLNDKTIYSYNKNNVQIKHSALSNDIALICFEYLKRIAQVVGLLDSDGGNILANRYNKIEFLDEENMLSAFLTGKIHTEKQSNNAATVYPFGFNMSQKTAIDNALENPLTIIEGPPGTGKTQTILNIIANVVMRNESIAIVSSNNSATANVQEKLNKYQVDFVVAYLGNSDNKTKFIESQKPLPDMASWRLTEEIKRSNYQSLQNLYTALSVMLVKKNELSLIRQELNAIELEREHFCKYCAHNYDPFLQYLKHITNSTTVLKLWFICEKYITVGKIRKWFMRFFNIFILRAIINKAFYSIEPDMIITVCQKHWYITKIEELKEKISSLQTELDHFNFDEKMKKYSSLSTQLFRDYLAEKYKNGERQSFDIDDLRKKSDIFIKEYPVIMSTTYSLRSSLSYSVMYDYVIIDESSQVDLATGALALSCARKAVIVGDLKQLPNVVDSEMERKTDAVFAEFNLPEVYRYKNHSLLLALSELFPTVPRTLLREHYRCHPKIIEFCNQKFYNNQLIVLTEPKSDRQPLVVYKTVPGNHARDHVNQRQIDVIKNEIFEKYKLPYIRFKTNESRESERLAAALNKL
jgi:superfamily I DNA and/or RNA helicase